MKGDFWILCCLVISDYYSILFLPYILYGILWEKEKKVIFTCPDSSSPLAYLPREGGRDAPFTFIFHPSRSI